MSDFWKNLVLGGMLFVASFISGCKNNNSVTPSNPAVSENKTVSILCYNTDTELTEQDVELYWYDSSVYNPEDGSGDLSSIILKSTPDSKSNGDGLATLSLRNGTYHILCHKDGQKDQIKFNIIVDDNPDDETEKRECWMKNGTGNYTSYGHIIHSGKYSETTDSIGNKYTTGDKVKMMIGGVNNDSIAHQTTFMIRRESDKSIIYTGTKPVSGENNETIEVTVAEHKDSKIIEWTIPPGTTPGKYKAFTDDGKHTGNFFVVEDNTPPEVASIDNLITYTGQTENIGYTIIDRAQPGTVRADQIGIGSDLSLFSIAYDPNYFSSMIPTSNNPVVVVYPVGDSGTKIFRIQATDASGNIGYKDLTITVNVNDNEAYNIMKNAFQVKGLFDASSKDSSSFSKSGVEGIADIYSPSANLYVEYRSLESGSSDSIDITDVEKITIEGWTANINTSGVPYVAIITPNTANQVELKIYQILTDLGY